MRVRKRPVVVAAVRWDGSPEALEEIRALVSPAERMPFPIQEAMEDGLLISTLEGTMRANLGDWIVKGTEEELYPVKPAAFASTYEPAEQYPPGECPHPREWLTPHAAIAGWVICPLCQSAMEAADA